MLSTFFNQRDTHRHHPLHPVIQDRPHRSLRSTLVCALSTSLLAGLMACAPLGPLAPLTPSQAHPPVAALVNQLLPADLILLGEQHDAPDHHRIEAELVNALVARQMLAALVLEMAEQGRNTQGLPAQASEEAVRQALQWNAAQWPWGDYAPAIMAAVRAGVPVRGSNLSMSEMQAAMRNAQFDGWLSGPALKAQQQRIRIGHCGLLPESQITPMTRVQIARDRAMAQVLTSAVQAGETVVLLAGRGHVDRALGVPQHITESFKLRAIAMQAQGEDAEPGAAFDALWPAQPAPDKDHCAAFQERQRR